MLVDTHSHLQDKEFDHDRDEILARAGEAGVDCILLVGEDLENSAVAIELARRRPECLATAGVHPHAAMKWKANAPNELLRLLQEPEVVAVGEIGLDFHYDFSTPDQQRTAFVEQLRIAQDTGMPVVLHCREAYEEMLETLRHISFATSPPHGVMHCYFGTVEQAQEVVAMGFLLGIGGSVTFNKAEGVREVVRAVSLDALVLETDAPYMAPVPHRGRRNEPSNIPLIAQRIAEVKEVPLDEVMHLTTQNARRLFRLGEARTAS